MKIFIDTANLDEIRESASMGILDGVTTNPSLVAKEKKRFPKIVGRNMLDRGWPDKRGSDFSGLRWNDERST